MELQNIDMMLKHYLEGESSLEEEKQLRAYFSSGNVAPQFKEYQVLFSFFKEEKKNTYQPVRETQHRKKAYTWFSIAAGVAIMVGIFIFGPTPQQNSGVVKDPEVALQKTKEVLHMIAQQMNNGKENLVYLTEINQTRNELIEQNLKLEK